MLANPSNSNSDPLDVALGRVAAQIIAHLHPDLAKLVLANKLPGGHVDPAAPDVALLARLSWCSSGRPLDFTSNSLIWG